MFYLKKKKEAHAKTREEPKFSVERSKVNRRIRIFFSVYDSIKE